MLTPTSRYRTCLGFEPSSEGRPVFRGLRPRDVVTLAPVLEHTLTAWDRPDLLSVHYYGDPERWWQILDANPELTFAGDITAAEEMAGTSLLIPRDTER